MKTEVWECEYCKSLLRTEKEYKKCKKDCAKKAEDQGEYERKRKEHTELADFIRLNAESVYDIPKMMMDFIATKFDRELKITKFDVRFDESVSNTHTCPINGQTNWGGDKKDVPRGYPGWHGRMEGKTNLDRKPIIRYDGEKIDGIFDVIEKWHALIRGIHSAGGSGSDNFGISIDIFVDDFPKIKANYERYLVLKEVATKAMGVHKKLIEAAQKEIVEQDERLNDFKAHKKVLDVLVKSNAALQADRTYAIIKSKEYRAATKIPQDHEYNIGEYEGLKPEFSK